MLKFLLCNYYSVFFIGITIESNPTMDTPLSLQGTLFVFASIGLAVLMQFLLFKATKVERREETQRVISSIFLGPMSAIYSLALAFILGFSLEEYRETRDSGTHEINALYNLALLTGSLDDEERIPLYEDIETYFNTVTRTEWKGAPLVSPKVSQSLQSIWEKLRQWSPQNQGETGLQRTALKEATRLSNYRRLRLVASRRSLPSSVWVFILGGGAMMVITTMMVNTRFRGEQILFLTAYTFLISFVIFILYSLDNPLLDGKVFSPKDYFELKRLLIQR